VGDSGAAKTIPPPCESLHAYGNVYGVIAVAAAISAAICLALVPLLKKWMHEGEQAGS
jgi:dipeptide/tripeptide permease